MRRLKGDKTDLSRVKFFRLFSLFIILSCTDIYSQLPLNGFCSLNKIAVNSSFGKIFTLDYDNDNKTDFLLFNPLNNYTAFQKNIPSAGKPAPVKRYSPIVITDLKPVIQYRRKDLYYFAISQRERKAALLSIPRGGGIRIISQYRFDGYPSALAVADVNGDGSSEAVVCGTNFKGISLFSLKGRLSEIKIVEDGIFSNVQFIDLNYDGFPDIAAYEARRNAIYFFMNDQNGNFRKSRVLNFDPSVNSFKTADINSDGYMDLVLLKNKGIYVLEGDSVSSFRKNEFIRTPVTPDEVTIDDYNGDGVNDIAFMNKKSGEFFLQISKRNGSYYYPVLLLKESGFADMKTFRDSYLKKIVLLNPDGGLYVISKFDSRKDPEEVTVSGGISALASFRGENPSRRELCLADDYQRALIILTGEPGNILSKYYSVRISDSFSRIAVDDSKKNDKIFFLFTPGKNLIEVIRYNLENLRIERTVLYTKGGIIDLKIKPSSDSEYPYLYILSNKPDPFFTEYRFNNYRYSEINSGHSGQSFIDASIAPGDSMNVFGWNRSGYGCDFFKSSINQPVKNRLLYKYSARLQDNFQLYTRGFRQNDKEGYINFSMIKNGAEAEGVVYDRRGIKNLSLDMKPKSPADFREEGAYLYADNEDKIKILFIYDFGNGIFYKADLNSRSRIISVRQAERVNGLMQYTVEKSAGRKMKLVYFGKNGSYLNFKEIE